MQSSKRLAPLWVAVALCTAPAWPVDFSALKPQGYVSDFSKVVDAASRSELERYCAQVEAATGAQIALVTVPTLQGEPVEDVANLMFRKWGIGQKGENSGILLLLVTGDRRSRLEVGYGLEPMIPDGFAGGILRQMRPALRANQYGEALLDAAQMIGSRIAEAKGVSIGTAPARRRPRAQEPLPWGTLIGAAVMLFWILGVTGRRRRYHGGFLPALLIADLLGRSALRGMGYSRRSHGGFGGYDSGDSFGGFGGGDSGGGGASSDW